MFTSHPNLCKLVTSMFNHPKPCILTCHVIHMQDNLGFIYSNQQVKVMHYLPSRCTQDVPFFASELRLNCVAGIILLSRIKMSCHHVVVHCIDKHVWWLICFFASLDQADGVTPQYPEDTYSYHVDQGKRNPPSEHVLSYFPQIFSPL